MVRAPVFVETYRSYLKQLEHVDLVGRAEKLGVTFAEGGLLISLYGKVHHLSATAITGPGGQEVSPAIRVILARYVLDCPPHLPAGSDRLVSYRQFADAAPLVPYFTANTNTVIATHFSGGLEQLTRRARSLGAIELPSETHDLSLRFSALPRIPVQLNFNDRDELFEAACSVLYRQSAQYYLDMECLAMTGTLLAGWLIDR